MNDRWEQTIPANTSEANKARVECKLSVGVLTKIMVYFPAGCQGLARCRVFLGAKPVAPRSPGSYLAGEDGAIVLEQMNEFISENRPILDWQLWNVDETYPHTLWMLAEWISEDEPVEERIYVTLKNLLELWQRRLGL